MSTDSTHLHSTNMEIFNGSIPSLYEKQITRLRLWKCNCINWIPRQGNRKGGQKSLDDDSHSHGSRGLRKTVSHAMLLVVVSIVFLLTATPCEGKQIKCPLTSIALRNKTTGIIEGCIACPPCLPSQQYSIVCGTVVDIGTHGRCLPCPPDMYSDGFNTKRCEHCNKCTNKVIKQNCTSFQNAICTTECIPGYYYDRHIFSCVPIKKRQRKTNIPTTEPTTPILETTKPTTIEKRQTTRPYIVTSGERTTLNPPTVGPTSGSRLNGSSTPKGVPNGDNSQLLHVAVALLCIVLLFIIIIAIVVKISLKHNFWKSRCNSFRPSLDEEAGIHPMIAMSADSSTEQLLKDFTHDNLVDAERVYKFVEVKKCGTWDFERIGKKWNFQKEDLLALKRENQVENGSAGKMLCEKLCSENGQSITVRNFANSLKNINSDAYKVLEPHFTIPAVTDTARVHRAECNFQES